MVFRLYIHYFSLHLFSMNIAVNLTPLTLLVVETGSTINESPQRLDRFGICQFKAEIPLFSDNQPYGLSPEWSV